MGAVLEFHTSPRISVATIVMKDRVNVLLGRVKAGVNAGKWVLPGVNLQMYESIQDCSLRGIREQTGLEISAKQMLFMSEKVDKPNKQHRMVVYCFGEYVSGEPVAGSEYTEMKWIDPRELGEIQPEMDDLTIDAFYKFSLVLRSQAQAAQ